MLNSGSIKGIIYSMDIIRQIPSDLMAAQRFISYAAEEIKALPFTAEQLYDIRLSLEEAIVNSIKHGNKFKDGLFVTVRLKDNGDGLTIIVCDQGQGFDYCNIPDPTRPANLQKPSGRGVFLMRSRMDEIQFSDGGRSIKMLKLFNKQGGSK